MRKLVMLFLYLISFLFVSCGIAMRSLSSDNRAKLVDISIGMSKQQVKSVMGTEGAGDATQPYKAETFIDKENLAIDIWYYLTDSWGGTDDEERLTPIVFSEGRVVGTGWKFLEGNKEKYEIKIKTR